MSAKSEIRDEGFFSLELQNDFRISIFSWSWPQDWTNNQTRIGIIELFNLHVLSLSPNYHAEWSKNNLNAWHFIYWFFILQKGAFKPGRSSLKIAVVWFMKTTMSSLLDFDHTIKLIQDTWSWLSFNTCCYFRLIRHTFLLAALCPSWGLRDGN